MKNSTLFFRTLALVVFIAGGAHLFSYLSYDGEMVANGAAESQLEKEIITDEKEENMLVNDKTPEKDALPAKAVEVDKETLTGQWKVEYDTEDYKGSIVYRIKNESGKHKAYTHEYRDPAGNAQKAEGDLVLVIDRFEGETGKGTYTIEYEGKSYEIEAKLKRVNAKTFTLSYDYYGYGDTETWKKL
ncbi:hypothetical protein [Sediminicola luteus]|uniref:Uncharacterized protein n=1 Tax=Sediminicola luteus TaxID=319238 RepID=A0A2A4G746_9FLAO|nr:hypothetical protein [Sediminicola luteus]PCE64789.1 hypothetical protein B7P33_06360 [Sediminicola luteus]